MAYSEPSGYNTFLPTAEATGYMTVAFGRNMQNWSVNRYMEIRPVTKSLGYYLRLRSEQAARVRYTDGREFFWADGAERPHGQDNLGAFEFEPYKTMRFAPGFTLGRKAIQQADWFLQDSQMQQIGQQSMTLRTLQAIDALTNATWGPNEANVDGVAGALNGNTAILASGQNWTNGTASTPNIKKTLLAVVNIINKLTLASYNMEDLALVISPDVAIPMASSPEVNAVMANSVFALGNITGQVWYNKKWGLPDAFNGVRIIVDETVDITARKKTLGTPAILTDYKYALDVPATGTAYVLLIPREKNDAGQDIPRVRANEVPNTQDVDDKDKKNYFPVVSTLVGFFYEELTVEAMDDPWNRFVKGSVVSDFDVVLSSPKSGFHLAHVLG